MNMKFYAVMALAMLTFTTLSARGGFGDERFQENRSMPQGNRPVYNQQNRINQTPGARGVEDAALMNRSLENGAGGGTVYQQAPAQPTYPAAPAPQTPY